MSKKESRLQFTDKERADPYLGESVRKAEKAAEKADKAHQKIPKKKVVKSELIADNSNGKIKVKLHFEDAEKKPPSKMNVASQEATKTAMRRRMQKELRQDEDDNAGIDAADAGVEAAESASQTFREVHRSVRMKPYRDAEKAERKLEKANIEYFQKKAEIENPTSNPFSKWRQKQEIKRQYAAAKAGHSTASTFQSAKAAKKTVKTTEESASFVVRHKKGIAIILGFLLMLSFLLNAMSSCSMIVEGVVSGIAATSYAAEDDAILGAEAVYCGMEAALQNKLDNYETTHDYDEYHYDLDEIWHDPYVLTAILSALHPGEWTLNDVIGTLDMLFEKLYEDNVTGKIDDARFAKMAKRYEQEQGEAAGKIKALRLELKKANGKKMDMDFFLETIRRYTDATTITRRMVGELIDHIDVYHAEKRDGVTNQRVVIHYNCIGAFDVPDRRKIPEADIIMETRKGVALSYAPAQIAV